MTRLTDFAYAQARLQARHGQRPDAVTWRRLAGLGDLLHYLQSARTTALRPWVLHFGAQTSVHHMELSLREQFRRYVHSVARWQPAPWRGAILWAQRLPDLPVLQHLLMGETAPPWLTDDPALKPFASENLAIRNEALLHSDYGPLLAGWRKGMPLTEAWLDHWRGLWPTAPGGLLQPLEALAALAHRHLDELRSLPAESDSNRLLVSLENRLVRLFRRHSQQPAAAFIHLALIALDVQHLRGALTRRALFPEPAGKTA